MMKKNFKEQDKERCLISIHAKVPEALKIRLDIYSAKTQQKKGNLIEQAIDSFLKGKGY